MEYDNWLLNEQQNYEESGDAVKKLWLILDEQGEILFNTDIESLSEELWNTNFRLKGKEWGWIYEHNFKPGDFYKYFNIEEKV